METAHITISSKVKPLIQEGVLLSCFSTMKVGGSARFFSQPKNVDELQTILSFAQECKLPIWILGGGSNTVFQDQGFSGVVIKPEIKGIEIIKEEEEDVYIRAYSGENWDEFVSFVVSHGFGGVENLTAIPGNIGGAIVQNIGAYGVEIKDTVYSVEIFDQKDNTVKVLDNQTLQFEYRESVFKKQEGKSYIVLSAVFKLSKHSVSNISYKDLNLYFKDKSHITIVDVRNALQEIRGKKFPDLNVYGTAGSFFKNCVIAEQKANELKSLYPDLPVFDMGKGYKKVGAAWLLDKVCGLRGFRVGNVGLFEHQSLVVVNFGNAHAIDIKNFIEEIKKIFFAKVGIKLEEEVIVL